MPLTLAMIEDLCLRQAAKLGRDDLDRDALLDVATVLDITLNRLLEVRDAAVEGHTARVDELTAALGRAQDYLDWVKANGQLAAEFEIDQRLQAMSAHLFATLRMLLGGEVQISYLFG